MLSKGCREFVLLIPLLPRTQREPTLTLLFQRTEKRELEPASNSVRDFGERTWTPRGGSWPSRQIGKSPVEGPREPVFLPSSHGHHRMHPLQFLLKRFRCVRQLRFRKERVNIRGNFGSRQGR